MKTKTLNPRILKTFIFLVFSISVFCTYNSQAQTNCFPLADNLIHWWDGDAVVESTATDIIGGINGNLENGVSFAPGMVDQAFSFSGNVAYPNRISTSLILNYETGITFDVWISTIADKGLIMSDGGGATLNRGMCLAIEPGGVLWLLGTRNIDSDNNFKIVGPSLNDGSFHHIVATWTGDTSLDGVNLYVDGNHVGSTTANQSIIDGDLPIYIGGHSLAHYKFNGLIDEVKIYNRALNSDEVLAIFNAGSAGTCKTPDEGNNDDDGDGVINAKEIEDGTNILNSCDFKITSQTVPASESWNESDCDGDGVINRTEIEDGTNPLDNCDYEEESITLDPTSICPDEVKPCACGKNKEKVLVCHNGIEICISKNALIAHLKHGDICGPCVSKQNPKLKSINIDSGIDPGIENEIMAYPNPFHNSFYIEIPEKLNPINIRVSDLLGRTIINTRFNNNSFHEIIMSGESPGLYFFFISDEFGLIEMGKIKKE